MCNKKISVFLIFIMILTATVPVIAGRSTPPPRPIIETKEDSSPDKDENEDYEEKTSRPVVDTGSYESSNRTEKPERPVITSPDNNQVVDISGKNNSGGKPERPIVDTTTNDNGDADTSVSQKPTRPSTDSEDIKESTPNNEDSNVENSKFPDITENHSNYHAIQTLAERNIILGDEKGYFRPFDYITRAEFVKIICTAFNLKMKTTTKSFEDVKTHWAKEFIYTAASNGVISGVSENRFAPKENITYQQIAKIIVELKGWGNNAVKLGGYPDGYVKVMINNDLFDNSTVETNSFKATSYYAKNSTRADVAQIVYNAILSDNTDKTVIEEPTDNKGDSQSETITKTTPYIVTNDLGEAVTGTNNPSFQQIYNYVYNRIKDREVYKKDPNVLNAIMAMIWTENKGIHYENGHISYSSNSSSKDYGICQLNDSVFPEAKYWGWRENLNAGIDKYASAYWMCMGEEAKNKVYAQSIERALQENKAQSYQDARARSAYCMYNHNNDARERWFTKNDTRDSNFYRDYVNKDWAKTLTETGNTVTVTKPQNSQTSGNTSTELPAIKYDGKTYTYAKSLKTSYKIATKAYSTDDYANIQDVWKLFYGYNPTFYDNNPLHGRLEWYCPGVGSLFVEYDMRNKTDGNTYQFDIYRFTQNGDEFELPQEYIGYNKILSNKVTMTKHGNIALIGIKNLANIFACDIDYKNQIKLSSTLKSNLQNVTDEMNVTNSSMETPSTINKISFGKVLENVANEHIGNKYDKYADEDIQWCVYCALTIAREAMKEYGCSETQINDVLPYASYAEGSTGKMILIYDNKGAYSSYTEWTNHSRKFSVSVDDDILNYIPKIGDFIAVETDKGKTIIPDHTGLIISVNRDEKTFVAIEGNTGDAFDENGNKLNVNNDGIIIGGKHNGEKASNFRKVRWVDYKYSDSEGKWVRTAEYGGSSYYVHGFMSPDYPN